MRIIGIVGEYNPFHMGHFHQLCRSKEALGADVPVICAMSGDFVQRGEAAIYSKFARAEAACRSGVDLVVELPLPWALSSAEAFGRGAVGLLSMLGVSHLSFGSELGEIAPLSELAGALLDEDIYKEVKRLMLRDGSLSFARARQLALEAKVGESARLLETPNNILAVEYLKAIKSLNCNMEAITVKRVGSAHDGRGDSPVRSASEIREMLRGGEDISAFVPAGAAAVFERERAAGRELSELSAMETAVLSRLRMLDRSSFEALPDAADGLGGRIYAAVRESASLAELYEAAKTKRYAMSRVRRACICAALGIKEGMNAGLPPYARVLAANERGCELLALLREKAACPVITKAAHVKALSSECTDMFALGASAHDLFSLFYKAPAEKKPGQDWRKGPVIVKN